MISTTGEYALRAAAYLSQHDGEPQTSAQIAEGTKVPQGYLSKVLQQLVRAGLVSSQRGIHGGFVLARPTAEITVLDVLRAVDSAPARITKCPLGIEEHAGLCPVHKLVDEAMAAIEAAFAASNLETLMRSATSDSGLCESH